jgi:YD repeat-containing protein
VKYTYDGLGHRTSITYADGRIAIYGYDAAARIIQVKDWAGRTTSYSYDAAGNRVSMTLGNGSSSIYTFDSANRLTAIENHAKQVVTSFSYILLVSAGAMHVH